MSKLENVGFQTTRKYLHRVLKNQGRLRTEDHIFFKGLLGFKLSLAGQSSVIDVIEPYLDQLEGGAQKFGDLLRRRFWKNETIRQVASSYHLSPDQINRLQREANRLVG